MEPLCMKRPDLFFTAVLVPLDALMIFAAGLAAFHLRLAPYFTNIRPVTFDLTLERFSSVTALAVAIWIVVFILSGVYRFSRRRLGEELGQIFFAGAAAMAVIFALLFFSLEAFDSRFIVLAGWAIAILFLWMERIIVRGVERSLRFFGIGVSRMVVIGRNDTADVLRTTFEQKPWLGMEIVGTYKQFDDSSQKQIANLARKNRIDDILLADPDASRDTLSKLKLFSDVEHLTLRYSADLFSSGTLHVEATPYAGIPIMTIKKTPLDGWGAIYKRAFDLIASLVLLAILTPVMIAVAMIITFETGLPVLFANERVGEKSARFSTLKFRSMRAEYSVGNQKGLGNQQKARALETELIRNQSKKGGPVYKIMEDPRITPFGRFIRKYSIDELPQLWNVLRGEMSLVGPRPHQPREVDQYLPHHKKVHTVKPGMTGLSQISGRSDLDFEDEVRLDTFYIENWSLWLDFVILIKTPLVVLLRRGAY